MGAEKGDPGGEAPTPPPSEMGLGFGGTLFQCTGVSFSSHQDFVQGRSPPS